MFTIEFNEDRSGAVLINNQNGAFSPDGVTVKFDTYLFFLGEVRDDRDFSNMWEYATFNVYEYHTMIERLSFELSREVADRIAADKGAPSLGIRLWLTKKNRPIINKLIHPWYLEQRAKYIEEWGAIDKLFHAEFGPGSLSYNREWSKEMYQNRWVRYLAMQGVSQVRSETALSKHGRRSLLAVPAKAQESVVFGILTSEVLSKKIQVKHRFAWDLIYRVLHLIDMSAEDRSRILDIINRATEKDFAVLYKSARKMRQYKDANFRTTKDLCSLSSYMADCLPYITLGKGATVHTILSKSVEWHERRMEEFAMKRMKNEKDLDVEFQDPGIDHLLPDGFRRLRTPRALHQESAEMHHCVWSYSSRMNEARYIVAYEGEMGRATVEVQDGMVVQSREYCNSIGDAARFAEQTMTSVLAEADSLGLVQKRVFETWNIPALPMIAQEEPAPVVEPAQYANGDEDATGILQRLARWIDRQLNRPVAIEDMPF